MSRKLEGQDRGLDALVGLVLQFAMITIGYLSVLALYEYGVNAPQPPANPEALSAGFGIAFVGGLIVVSVATLIYLIRLVSGRRSWTAPFWGVILLTVAVGAGYLVMTSG